MKRNTIISIAIITLVVLADQILKIWIKTNMTLGQEIPIIGDRILIHFTENPGMAFGMAFGGETGKFLLTAFRALAIVGLVYFLIRLIKKDENIFYIICISLVIAGAFGNLIDSMFYGMIFTDSIHQLAQIFPPEGGYGKFMHGHVVDMFYCPVIDTILPEWIPFKGGERFVFFRPVFNIADSAITTSVFLMIIFYKKIFKSESF
jgi:signal peptidase II